jgi:hypothetical protein
MSRYVLAVKREMWGRINLVDALDRVRSIPGYRVVGGTSSRRTVIEATPRTAKLIESALEDVCYVEPEVEFFPQR